MSEIKMQSIVQDVLNLGREDRVHVAKMIYRHNPDLIYMKPDGCRVILNKLNEELINKIHNFIQYKLTS
jgi:hypothetical protein